MSSAAYICPLVDPVEGEKWELSEDKDITCSLHGVATERGRTCMGAVVCSNILSSFRSHPKAYLFLCPMSPRP